MHTPMEEQLREAIARWDAAMTLNDADEIGRYMKDDWVIIGADGSMDGKDRFLDLIRSGALSHDVMETQDLDIRVYGGTAVVIASGVSGGTYQGQPFLLQERMSCVYVRQAGSWLCALTHLSPKP